MSTGLHTYNINPESLPEMIRSDEKLAKAFSYTVVKPDETNDITPESYYLVPTLFLLDEYNRHGKAQEAMQAFCESLPCWKGNEHRHVFLDQSDFCVKPDTIKDSIIFTVTPKASEPTHRALPFWPYRHDMLDVENLISKDIEEDARFDLFFKGCGSTSVMPVRKKMIESVSLYERDGLACYVQTYNKYFWNRDLTDEEKSKERKHYFERMTDSKFVLCPKGAGTTSSRFFETMYFGRIPVLISDDICLPLENKIDWDNLIVRVKEDDLDSLGQIVRQFISKHDLRDVSTEIKRISNTYFVKEAVLNLIRETLE